MLQRPHLGARRAGFAEIGHQRIGERADRTADMAPAVIDAGGPVLEVGRVHGDRRRHHADVVGGKSLEPDLAVLEGLHRRHRVVAPGRPPQFFRLGIAGDADVVRDLVVPRRDVLIGDRPVVGAVVLALDAEIVRQQARHVGEPMQRGAADAPAAVIADRRDLLALENEGRPRRLDAAAPHVR